MPSGKQSTSEHKTQCAPGQWHGKTVSYCVGQLAIFLCSRPWWCADGSYVVAGCQQLLQPEHSITDCIWLSWLLTINPTAAGSIPVCASVRVPFPRPPAVWLHVSLMCAIKVTVAVPLYTIGFIQQVFVPAAWLRVCNCMHKKTSPINHDGQRVMIVVCTWHCYGPLLHSSVSRWCSVRS
jgi:hypothetical protein